MSVREVINNVLRFLEAESDSLRSGKGPSTVERIENYAGSLRSAIAEIEGMERLLKWTQQEVAESRLAEREGNKRIDALEFSLRQIIGTFGSGAMSIEAYRILTAAEWLVNEQPASTRTPSEQAIVELQDRIAALEGAVHDLSKALKETICYVPHRSRETLRCIKVSGAGNDYESTEAQWLTNAKTALTAAEKVLNDG